jgi:hypothetical protein
MPRRSVLRAAYAALTFLTIIFMLSACSIPLLMLQENATVRLILDAAPRTLDSDLSTEAASYEAVFSNSDGEEVIVTSDTAVIEASLPSLGTWTIDAYGFNDSGIQITEGQTSVNVESPEEYSTAVTLSPLTGDGSTVLEIQWNPVQVRNPSVDGELIAPGGQTHSLDFTVTAEGVAECSSPVPAGYYTLRARLLDDTHVVAGIAEAVRVLQGGTTQELFQFDAVNKPGVMVEVTSDSFAVDWDQPVDDVTGDPVSVSGYRLYYREHGVYQWQQLAELPAGTTRYTVDGTILSPGVYEFAVTALYVDTESELHTCFDDTADPTYGWYVAWQQ